MTKNYYTDYVQHMIRFYSRTNGERPTEFRTDVDETNWETIDMVIHNPDASVTQKVIDIGMAISADFGFVKDKVATYCAKTGETEDTVWQALRDFERRVAQVRGLA